MKRTPEPELMEGLAQAQAYAEADFSQANALFLRLFATTFPNFTGHARVVDLGCGPGHILSDFAQKYPKCTCLGIDGSAAMLSHGQKLTEASNGSSVTLQCSCLPLTGNFGKWQVILANSLLHHLADPTHLWQSIARVAAPGALVLIMDLCRPSSETAAAAIVKKYSSTEPQILQEDFYRSLLAAYRLSEVMDQLQTCGFDFKGHKVSDRHLAVWGRM